MKKYNAIISLLLTLLLSLSFTSCNNSNSSENTSTTKPLSPIEQLNENEKRVYDALLIDLYDWANPTEVKFIEFNKSFVKIYEYGSDHINMKALAYDEEIGANKTDYYWLNLDTGEISQNDIFFITPSAKNLIPDESKISAKKIQAAIDQYWKDQGLK